MTSPSERPTLKVGLNIYLNIGFIIGFDVEKIIPISDLQSKTKEVIDGVKKTGDPVIITQRGRPAALVVNYEQYEGMLHTLDEMSYPDWQERLREAEEDSRKGKGITLEELKKKVAKQRAPQSGRRRQIPAAG